MKKYLIFFLVVLLLILGCAKKNPIIEYDQEAHDKILDSLGKTTNSRVVIKLNKSSNDQFYVYDINNINFTLYNYEFFNTKADYEKSVNNYKEDSSLELVKDDDALVTRILLKKGSKSDGAKDLMEAIINKYKDNEDYEIIE